MTDDQDNLIHSDQITGDFIDGNARVTEEYGAPRGNSQHAGLDLKPIDANGNRRTDAIAISAAEGTVELNEIRNGYGQTVVIRLANGDHLIYGHLQTGSTSHLDVGEVLNVGDRIGLVGNTGTVIPAPTAADPWAGLHLHVEIRRGQQIFSADRVGLGTQYTHGSEHTPRVRRMNASG